MSLHSSPSVVRAKVLSEQENFSHSHISFLTLTDASMIEEEKKRERENRMSARSSSGSSVSRRMRMRRRGREAREGSMWKLCVCTRVFSQSISIYAKPPLIHPTFPLVFLTLAWSKNNDKKRMKEKAQSFIRFPLSFPVVASLGRNRKRERERERDVSVSCSKFSVEFESVTGPALTTRGRFTPI